MQSITNTNFFPNRSGYSPRYVILHGTAGGSSAEATARYFQTVQVSSNYVIGTDGEVVLCVPEKDGAWANGYLSPGHDPFWNEAINPNLLTISIEHCKPSIDNSNLLTEPQKQASFQLIKDICKRWNIPQRWADKDGGITGHFSLDPVNRSNCPGPYPFDELCSFLNQENTMLQPTDTFAATYFSIISNDVWHCKTTNQDIAYGILSFYRSIQGAPRLPITGEISLGAGAVYQVFEAGIIIYDPERKRDVGPAGFGSCYMVMLNSDLGRKILGLSSVDKASILQAVQMIQKAIS